MDSRKTSTEHHPGSLAGHDHHLKRELYDRVRRDSEIFEFLQAGSLDGIWYWDIENPREEWLSPRCKELFGYRDEEVPNTSAWWQENIFPEDLVVALDNLKKHCDDPNHPYDQVVRYRHKNGSTVWVRCRGIAIRNTEGKPIRMLGAHTDVTAIKRTEERLRALYQASPDMYFEADLETAIITDCNQALRDDTGYSQLVGKSLFDICHVSSLARARSSLITLKDQPQIRDVELTLNCKNQEPLPILLSVTKGIDSHTGHTILRGWCRDIRHLKNPANLNLLAATLTRESIDNGLRESEHHFRQLAESLPQLVWACTPDGMCSYLSPQWIGYTGIPEAEQLNLRWLEQIHPDDREPISTAWSKALRAGEMFQFYYRIRRWDGQYRWFDTRAIPMRNSENQIVKWFGSSTDIHEARETSAALERERENLAKLVTLAPAIFCSLCLRPDGTSFVPYASPHIFDLLGLHPDELKLDSAKVFAQFHPDDRTFTENLIQESARTLSDLSTQFRYFHPQKGERWIEGTASPSADQDGSIVWHGFLRDITGRKHLEFDQRFLADLSASLQTASGPEATVHLATQMLGDYMNVERCSLSAINVPLNEFTLLNESTRGGVSPVPPGTFPLDMWAAGPVMDLLSAGQTLHVENTITDPITAHHYPQTYQPLGIGAVLSIPLRSQGQWVAALSLAISAFRSWSPREMDLARAAAERIWPAYQAARALAAERSLHLKLAAGEERLRLALQSTSIGIWEQNPETKELHWDERSKAMYGFALDQNVDVAAAAACIHPDDLRLVLQASNAFRDPAGNGRFDFEYRIHHQGDGAVRYIYAQGQTFFEGDGPNRKAIRSVGTYQDITERRLSEISIQRSLVEKQALLQEVHHRVKNNLQIISSLLSMQATGITDKETIAKLADSERRVRSMAIIHEYLYRQEDMSSIDLSEYVRDLATELFSSYVDKPMMTYRLEVAPIQIAINNGVPCGLILNELVSNALKYAYPNGHGEILIRLSSKDDIVSMSVSDNGVGLPAGFDRNNTTSLGMTIVQVLVGQLDGELEITNVEGAHFTVRFPNRIVTASPPQPVRRVAQRA